MDHFSGKMEIAVGKTRFVCVDYPAIVENVDKMLETLGGEYNVNKAYRNTSRRLNMRWRPTDIHCKPVFGDLKTVTRLVLKVKRKKPTDSTTQTTQPPSEDEGVEAEILGTINSAYTFTGMSDFQYLPMQRETTSTEADPSYRSIVNDLSLTMIQPRSWLHLPTPRHIQPALFSRLDMPSEYNYRDDPTPKKRIFRKLVTSAPNYILADRKRRPHHTLTVEYSAVKDVPTEASPEALERLDDYLEKGNRLIVDSVKAAFEEKPTWSKTELIHNLPVSRETLKIFLSAFAYYWISGPWRTMWTRLGYDPRKDPSSKIHQTLDSRLRMCGPKLSFHAMRSRTSIAQNSLRLLKTKQLAKPALICNTLTDAAIEKDEEPNDSHFVFRPGVLPPYRQMFYQLMHVRVDEVQELVHCNNGQETECTEKDGWLLPNTMDKCRSILTRIINSTINPPTDTTTDVISTKGKSSAKHKPKNTSQIIAMETDTNKSAHSNPQSLLESSSYVQVDDSHGGGVGSGEESGEEMNDMEEELLELATAFSADEEET